MMLKDFLVVFLFVFAGGLIMFFKEVILDKFSAKSDENDSLNILHKLEFAPDFYLDEVNASSPIFESEKCHFFNCFNIYRCVDHSGKQVPTLFFQLPKTSTFKYALCLDKYQVWAYFHINTMIKKKYDDNVHKRI